jgi:hypothetical protein
MASEDLKLLEKPIPLEMIRAKYGSSFVGL